MRPAEVAVQPALLPQRRLLPTQQRRGVSSEVTPVPHHVSSWRTDRTRERAFDELLDLEHAVDDETRIVQLHSLLITELAPRIQRGSTIAGLRAMLADGSMTHHYLKAAAQEVLLANC
jgi:hypothetical protein